MKKLIPYSRSVIVAADVPDIHTCIEIAKAVKDVPRIKAIKVGFLAGLKGLPLVVEQFRNILGEDMVIIYDHQKAANDIPEMGPKFARELKNMHVDAAILFPFAGPKTQRVWTASCHDAGLHVIVGAVMTHDEFLQSEGGYIANDAPWQIITNAFRQGVRDFVVPGTKIEWVTKIRDWLGNNNYTLYAPGFITQGGDITECGKAAGPNFHAIVGGAIYEKKTHEDMRAAAIEITSKLVDA